MSVGRRSRTFRALLPLFAGAVLLFGSAMPQALAQLLQGSISGNVSDASQAAVASAKVSATDENTGLTRATVANSTGVYDIPVLPPGTYKLTISASGFQTAVRTGVVVAAQTATRVDVMLNVGALTESVQVAASATSLQTDRMDVRSELGSQQLSNLPVPIGRNYQNIFTTLPGFSPPQNSHSFSANGSRSLMFTVNGGNINSNETRVDGAGTRNFSATDVILYVPNLDSIDTVNVATNSLEADQSAGGAFVNVTVKSGTNALHGSIFETHSNQHLEAYQWAADRTAKKLPFIDNQFGASAGGPIRKDRMFFFASYEGVRLVQGNVVNAQVPTAAMKAGNLSASPTNIYDPLTGAANGTGRTPFADKLIPAIAHRSGGQGDARYRGLVESESGWFGRVRSVAQLPVPWLPGQQRGAARPDRRKIQLEPQLEAEHLRARGLQQRRLVQPGDFRATRRACGQSDQHFGRGGRGEGLEQYGIGELHLQPVAAAGCLFRLLPD